MRRLLDYLSILGLSLDLDADVWIRVFATSPALYTALLAKTTVTTFLIIGQIGSRAVYLHSFLRTEPSTGNRDWKLAKKSVGVVSVRIFAKFGDGVAQEL